MMTAAAGALIAGCTQAPPPPQSAQGSDRLQQLLAGKAAGPATNCIPGFKAGGAPSFVTPTQAVFEINPGLIYVSDIRGSGCEDAADPSNILVTRSYGSLGLCQGDTMRILDLQTKVVKGACTLSEFVPYRRAG
jgi:hypothetical protein